MTDGLTDQQLLREFSERRSDQAFASLVQRHVDLVFATALRQVGQPPAAQEVAQNVFIALARKAVWLRAEISLSGWLHKTTLLEARQWWRSEFRRQRREQTAVELRTTMKEEDSLLASLPKGLLDEGLMELREADRQALLLRFFEDRSHRDIGAALGVGEDAVRKRIDKALEKLSAFFRRQGYAVSSGSAAVALQSAAQAAPAGLSNLVVQAALSTHGAATVGGLTLTIAKLMGLTKTQTGLVCAGLAALPVAYQWHAYGELQQEQIRLTTQLHSAQQTLGVLQSQRDTLESQARLFQPANARNGSKPGASKPVRPVTLWGEDLNSIQIPKAVLAKIKIPAIGEDGLLMEEMAHALDLDPRQIQQANQALTTFSARYHELEAAHSRPTDERPSSMHVTPVSDQKTILCDAFPEDYQRLLTELKGQVTQILGSENSAYFWTNTAGSNHEEFDPERGSLPKRLTIFRPKSADPNASYYIGVEYQDQNGNWGSARMGPVQDAEEIRAPMLKSIAEDWEKNPLAPNPDR